MQTSICRALSGMGPSTPPKRHCRCAVMVVVFQPLPCDCVHLHTLEPLPFQVFGIPGRCTMSACKRVHSYIFPYRRIVPLRRRCPLQRQLALALGACVALLTPPDKPAAIASIPRVVKAEPAAAPPQAPARTRVLNPLSITPSKIAPETVAPAFVEIEEGFFEARTPRYHASLSATEGLTYRPLAAGQTQNNLKPTAVQPGLRLRLKQVTRGENSVFKRLDAAVEDPEIAVDDDVLAALTVPELEELSDDVQCLGVENHEPARRRAEIEVGPVEADIEDLDRKIFPVEGFTRGPGRLGELDEIVSELGLLAASSASRPRRSRRRRSGSGVRRGFARSGAASQRREDGDRGQRR